jgi:predicted N-acetyltransferase YhbS
LTNKNRTKCTAYNERFGATAAGSADLKSSAEMPPLRQSAIPLAAIWANSVSGERHWGKFARRQKKIARIVGK